MDFIAVSEDQQKCERAKARELRKSQWWRTRLRAGICYYCEKKFTSEELTMDHKVPIARGGRSTPNNVVPCCKACNTEKRHLTLVDWIQKKHE